MDCKGLVSVIIPCYNHAEHLKDAIDSVLAQDYPLVQVIVVNDGSTDGSSSVAKGYGGAIEVIDQPNKGRSIARNVGLDRAKGEFIKLLDADDTLATDCLRRQADGMRNGSVWNEAATFRVDAAKSSLATVCARQTDMDVWRRLLTRGGFPTCALLVRASALQNVRFREGMEYGEDTLFQSMLWQNIGRPPRIPFVQEAKCFVRFTGLRSTKYHPRDILYAPIALLESWDDAIIGVDGVREAGIERLAQTLSSVMRRGYRNKDYLRRARNLVRRLCVVSGVDDDEALANLNRVVRAARMHARIRRVRSYLKASLIRLGVRRLVRALQSK